MKPLFFRLRHLYKRFFSAFDYLQSTFLLLIRLYWGWQLIQSGWGKLHNLEKVTEFFTSLGLPMPAQMAVFISCVELFGGIFLALGLLSRLTALVLTINLITAYITADREALFSIFSDPDKFYAAAPYTFLVASLIVLIFGAGKFSLDTLFDRWVGKHGAQ
jgi:putative oxidoreductase